MVVCSVVQPPGEASSVDGLKGNNHRIKPVDEKFGLHNKSWACNFK